MSRYDPATLEPKWQAAWDEAGTFVARGRTTSPSITCWRCSRIPRAASHIGHVRNYTMGDVIARYKLARGLQRAASDGLRRLGMPAENAAMASGGHPADWTYAN